MKHSLKSCRLEMRERNAGLLLFTKRKFVFVHIYDAFIAHLVMLQPKSYTLFFSFINLHSIHHDDKAETKLSEIFTKLVKRKIGHWTLGLQDMLKNDVIILTEIAINHGYY